MLWKLFAVCLVAGSVLCSAQQAPPATGSALTLGSLDFLLGTWTAKTGGGASGATAQGTYTFRRDLGGHALQRTSSTDACTGPQAFDCQHHDQLTIFSDSASPHGAGLLALYLDSEGHVIYYTVAMPDAHTAVFASVGPAAAPHFRLTYHLEGGLMTGKFQGAAPGSEEYRSYLEWSGSKP